MFISRPLFSLALSVLFGEMLFCPELPFSLRFILLLFYLFYLSLLFRKKKQKILLLSLFLFFLSSLHFQNALKRFEKQQECIERVLPLNCTVEGSISYISENETAYRIVLKNCIVNSSLGKKPKELGKEEEEKWEARNNLPFQKIQVLFKKNAQEDSELLYYPGDRIVFHGKFMELSPAMNEGEFSFLQYCKGEGIEAFFLANKTSQASPSPLVQNEILHAMRATLIKNKGEVRENNSSPFLKLLYKLKRQASRDLEKLYPEQQSAFLKSLFLGEKSALSKEEKGLYQEAGIAHILAVSGLHLSLVGGTCFVLLRLLGMELSYASILSSFFVLSFALFTGSSGSTLRAMLMFFVYFFGKNLGRGQDRISSLSLSLLLLLFLQPLFLYSVGFQCSFYSLFLLLLLSLRDGKERRKALSKKWERAKRKKRFTELLRLLPKKIKEGGKELFLFYLGLFPLFSFLQSSLPLYAPLLNLLLLPLLPFIFLLGILSILFSHLPPLFFPLVKLLSQSLSFLLSLFHSLICFSLQLPYSSLLLGKLSLSALFLYLFLFYILFLFPLQSVVKRRRQMQKKEKEKQINSSSLFISLLAIKNICYLKNILSLLFLCIIPLFLPSPPKDLEITALYVGQGDGFLIRKGNFVMTIDNGSSSDKHFPENTLLPYCKAKRIHKIRYALITHSDIDHTSGIQAILEEGSTENYKSNYKLQIENLILPVQAKDDYRYDLLKRLAGRHGARLLYWKNGNSIVYGNKNHSVSGTTPPSDTLPPSGTAPSSDTLPPSGTAPSSDILPPSDTAPSEKSAFLSLRCYYPLTDAPMEEANAHSLGCVLQYGDFSMVFTGDMPEEAEKEMLSAIKKEGQSPSVDIVKLAHHGSKTSSSPIFLSETKGSFALFSYGKNNRYGHPHQITLEKCSYFRLIPLETAKLGEIQIKTDGKKYEIVAPCRVTSSLPAEMPDS
ncbi:ComEC/Rec2 family competence protein [Oribacterium parvum]|uniref:ComEC/Rec2 family competence protein n=1 Tax=Oribacterium parvum TaxID=1501329 RepID=UPI0028E24D2B|nr:ComEC/Rec2 family competence protein [Oribacterium parvum]